MDLASLLDGDEDAGNFAHRLSGAAFVAVACVAAVGIAQRPERAVADGVSRTKSRAPAAETPASPNRDSSPLSVYGWRASPNDESLG